MPWCIFFHPAKVPLKAFSILFKIYWACCEGEPATEEPKTTTINIQTTITTLLPDGTTISVNSEETTTIVENEGMEI